MLAVGVHAQLVGRRRDLNGMFRAIVVGARSKGNKLTILPGFVAGMFVTIGFDEHHLYGKVRLDLDRGRIFLMLDVNRIGTDFIATADDVEDLRILVAAAGLSAPAGRTGNKTGNKRRVREREIIRIMTTVDCGSCVTLNRKSAVNETIGRM